MFSIVHRFYLLWFMAYTFYTIAQDSHSSPCSPAANCTECLLQGPQCTWCSQKAYALVERCDTREAHYSRGCDVLAIINPTSRTSYKQNASVRNANLSLGLPAIQISPQNLQLKLTPGRSVKIPITFRIAEDYPVDLYYIMDMSYSMLDDKSKIIDLGELLAKELTDISKDVRLGFGAFNEKPLMPFISTRPALLQNPCIPSGICAPPYGYIHQLSLTNNTSIFGDQVRETEISANQDGPEGGFDALIQAMACTKKIGWREDSRKIILFSTDAQSHIAADGRIAGVLEPNDGHCHLERNEYSKSTTQDYPSISQIASIASETSTSIIFAVADYESDYRLISQHIPNSVVGRLANDSSNIVSLVRDQYESLIKTVTLGSTGLPDNVKLVMRTNCSSADGKMEESDTCESGIGQYVHFEAEVILESCSKSATYTFGIKPLDLSERVTVELELSCECDCGDKVLHSERCSGYGTYQCGICSCDEGFSGESCQCSSSDQSSADACLNPLTRTDCSLHGECNTCGKCQCDCLPGELEPSCDRYSGEYCECNTKSCLWKNGFICSGNGECVCDEYSSTSYCQCFSGFLGQDCSCPVSDSACRSNNGTGEICNDKGDCLCGKCSCSDACYSGLTCSILKPECSRACVSFKECVVCKVNPLESASVCTGNSACAGYNIVLVPELETEGSCSYENEEGCLQHYRYEFDHTTSLWTVSILNQPVCQKDYWLEVIIGVCVGVLLLGILALIIWKWVVTLHDREELRKFEKEAQQARLKSTENPLYKPATSTYRNPMYRKVAIEEEDGKENGETHAL
ncbi:integrin beta-6-like [Watersipora subatra]|uniref:integrin beta-6-like n=1 Tax=Watersipora subatra TaxID=2589382 RepID=UPI00355AE95F